MYGRGANRYGVAPGYGYVKYNGLQDLFTATATAALEVGALPYARGLIDNQYQYYIRDDGAVLDLMSALYSRMRSDIMSASTVNYDRIQHNNTRIMVNAVPPCTLRTPLQIADK
jgi:hypothetical protein